jgi:hypothetical protein
MVFMPSTNKAMVAPLVINNIVDLSVTGIKKTGGRNSNRRKNASRGSRLLNSSRSIEAIMRLLIVALIIIWLGVALTLVSSLSSTSSPQELKQTTADGTIRGGGNNQSDIKSSAEIANNRLQQPSNTAASIFELSLLGNTSPKDFKLHTPNAPSCSSAINSDEISFTLVSQLSQDRIWMIPYHCKRWGKDNPMSIVIFTDENAEDVKRRLVTPEGGCSEEQLTVQTVSKTRYDPTGTNYPVNVLRNLAFSKVRTSHLVYVDIDFWPSEDLHSILNTQSVKERMASDPKLATVIPVFQMNRRCRQYKDCREENIPFMPRQKDELITLMKRREATTFDPTNEGGHGSTRYTSWKNQLSGSYLDLPCIKSNRYEPYLVLRYCNELPPFQEGFSGYGKNKMTWAMQLRRSGYLFSQLGEAFLVHYPHLDSDSRMKWDEKPPLLQGVDSTEVGDVLDSEKGANIDMSSFTRARIDALFLDYRDWLRDNIEDVSRVPMCDNALNDDVRLWVHRDRKEKKVKEESGADKSKDDDDESDDQVE